MEGISQLPLRGILVAEEAQSSWPLAHTEGNPRRAYSMTETPASWLHDCGCLSLAAGPPAPCVDLAGQCGTWHGLIQVICQHSLPYQPTPPSFLKKLKPQEGAPEFNSCPDDACQVCAQYTSNTHRNSCRTLPSDLLDTVSRSLLHRLPSMSSFAPVTLQPV